MKDHTGSAKMGTLDAILDQLRQKRAEDMGDKGTTHISKDEDNGTVPATEGARGEENDADVKVQINLDVGSAPANTDAVTEPEALTTAKPTGEDPSTETASAEDFPNDSGTTHPARVDGGKIAAEIKAACDKDGVEAVIMKLSSELLAAASSTEPATKAAAAAGAAAADADMQKIAALVEANLPDTLDSLVKEAALDADRFVSFVAGALISKVAENEDMDTMGEGEMMPDDGVAQLAEIASSGMAPAEEALLDEAPLDEAPLDPAALEGAEGEELIAALSEALDEAGITPEELVEAVASTEEANPAEPLDAKMAAVRISHGAALEVNAYRNRRALGRHVKRASMAVSYGVLCKIRELMASATRG